VIGASDNETGNQKYGGDWILENTREDIVGVYFTGAIVTDFKGTLASITTSTTLTQAYLETSSNWPITISGGTSTSPVVVTIGEDATIPALAADNGYFSIGSDYITIDGGNKTLTIAYTEAEYSGLVLNGIYGTSGKNNVTIQNIKITTASSSVTLMIFGGWIGRSYFGRGATNNKIENCTTTSTTISGEGGGIVGYSAGYNSGQVTVTNCTAIATTSISGSAGGIVGSYAGYNSGQVTITSCTAIATTTISGGGIVGTYAGSTSGNVIISNCTATATSITGGGIVGYLAGNNSGKVTISDCSSSGSITGQWAGGIIGYGAGYQNGQVTISNCYSSGSITGQYAGGISGDWFGYNTNQLCKIENCYSSGSTISGTNSGGICGGEIGFNNSSYTPQIQITNCYVLGTIAATCGGICGGTEDDTYQNTPNVTISNCYLQQSGNLIAPSLQIKNSITTSNNAQSTGTWNDQTASGALLGAPSTFPGIGTIWTSSLASTPFVFSTSSVPCLCRGMMILTPSGYVPIESLKEGELLLVPPFYDRTVEIRRVFSSTYVGTKENVPYRIPAHFFERNKPTEDILLSPHHLVFYNGKWHLPCQVEGLKAEEGMIGERFEYYHIALSEYYSDKIWCNNMAVDSWDDSDLSVDPVEKEKEALIASTTINYNCRESTVSKTCWIDRFQS